MKILSFFLLLLLVLSCSSSEQQIYEWRGENRAGIYPGEGLLNSWPEAGPVERWYADSIGRGYGSPLIAGDRLFITGEIDGMSVLHCMDLEGNRIWDCVLGKEWITSFPGSRSAPTVAGDLIYVGTGMGNLYCVRKEDGNIIWSKDFLEDFQGAYPLHGHTEAAVVHGDRVFWTPGGSEFNVVALNRYTGEMIWSNPGHRERSAYNAANLVKLQGRHIYVTFSAYHIMGLDAETGELLWSQEQESLPVEQRDLGYGDTHPNAVIYEKGTLFYAASDGNDGVRLDLSEDGSRITEVWRNPGFDSFMGGIVKIGNYIYGTGDTKKQLKAINAATGVLTDSLKVGWGTVIAADKMLYYYNQQGAMKLISYKEGKLKEVSSFKINRGTGQHFSHPVIHNGILYQRHGQVLMAFDISFS